MLSWRAACCAARSTSAELLVPGAVLAHRKTRRRKRSAVLLPTADATASPGALCRTVCAIVPLYPNDDTPPMIPPVSPGPIAARP
eukprot:scaffold1194_cov63-Phaeocystis_antarctica.AAC.1